MALRPPSRASKFAWPKSRYAPVGDAGAPFVGPRPDSDFFPFPPPERAQVGQRATAPTGPSGLSRRRAEWRSPYPKGRRLGPGVIADAPTDSGQHARLKIAPT